MRFLTFVSAALVAAAFAGPAAAEEIRAASPKPAVSAQRDAARVHQARTPAPITVAMADPVDGRRCQNLLCPMYVVLGSGF